MIKIFEIISSVTLGGAQNLTFTLIDSCTFLHPGKFEFIVVELYASKSFYSLRKKVELKRKGIKVVTLGGSIKRLSLLIAPFKLYHLINSENPQIIHSHTDLPDFVLSLALRLKNTKNTSIIRTIHNTELWSEYYLVGKIVESSFKEDIVVGVSKAALNSYCNIRKKYNLPISQNRKVVYNGCNLPNTENHHFEIDKTKINIAFCGRFVHQKGIDILVDLIAGLESRIMDKFLFHFIGDGNYMNQVQKLKRDKKNIFIYGPVTNLPGKVYDFDYIIMPSRYEGLPLISIESSLSGVPVIAARSPGLDETFPNDWPLFFDLENPEQVVDLFNKIINSELDRDSLKQIAFNFVSEKFSMNSMIDSYAGIYLY